MNRTTSFSGSLWRPRASPWQASATRRPAAAASTRHADGLGHHRRAHVARRVDVQTTLYDQIRYSGARRIRVGLAHPRDGRRRSQRGRPLRFDRRASRRPRFPPPSPNCPSPNCQAGFAASANATVGGGASESPGTVTVLKQENVGPYATVQLQATDSSALQLACPKRIRHPSRRRAGRGRIHQRGIRLSRHEASAQSGCSGDETRASHHTRSVSFAALAYGRRGHGARGGHHDLGRRRRPLRAPKLPVLSHR